MVRLLIVIITIVSIGLALILINSNECIADDTIKLGVAGAHSGELGKYGIPILRAAEMVVKEKNANGGVLGKKIELIAKDDKCKKELAPKIAKKLVSEGAHMVMGHMCTPATWAALDIYKSAKTVAMSPSATDPRLTKSNYPNFFRTIAPDDIEAKLQVELVLNRLGLRKIAVIHDKSDYGKVLAKFVNAYLKKDSRAKVVLSKGISPGAKDYSKVIKKIESTKADGVIYGGYYTEATKMLMEMRKKNMKTYFISDNGAKDDDFIKIAGEYAEGVFVSGKRTFRNNVMARRVYKAYRKLYGIKPGPFFFNSYAATMILITATEHAGSTDYKALTNMLHKKSFETPIGEIRFDENGDAINAGYAIYEIKNGVFSEYLIF